MSRFFGLSLGERGNHKNQNVMEDNKYKTNATFTTVNGSEMSYDPILESACKYFEYQVKCGRMSEEDAQDAMQEAALKIIKASKGFDDTKSKFGSKYGRRVAQSCFQNDLDKKYREVKPDESAEDWCSTDTEFYGQEAKGNKERVFKKVSTVFSEYEYEDEGGEFFTRPEIAGYRAEENNPERDLVSNENVLYIWSCIDLLSAKDKEVALMMIEGQKSKKIALYLGCTPDAASVRVHRIRRTLENGLGAMLKEYRICGKGTRNKRCQAA